MLEYCPLTAKILQVYAGAVKNRDRVEFRADGTYELLPERKKRYKSKSKEKPSSNGTCQPDGATSAKEPEVIDLD